jgi:hypothetical protein
MVVGDQKWWKYYVFMYVTIKMRPVESMPGMRDVVTEENDELGEFQNDQLQELL